MEIILKEDIVNLGYKNDIVTVKSGYGRNYLIPTGKAVIASPSAKKMLAEELKQRAHKLEKIRKDAEELAAKLEGVSLKIATKVSSTGTIFGSVGNIQIAEELAKLGHEIDRKIIVVKYGGSAIFLKACAELGVAPERAYAIEDSYNGIRAAHAGHLLPIMVPDLLPANEEMQEKAEVVLPDLFEVIAYLKGEGAC